VKGIELICTLASCRSATAKLSPP